MDTKKTSPAVRRAAGDETWAVFLDLDGTLMAEKHLVPQRNLDAIDAARAKGHLVFLSTGRSLAHIPDTVTETVRCDGIITGNGALILMHGEVLQDVHMSHGLILRVGQSLFSHRECWALFEGKHKTYAISADPAKRKPHQIPLECLEDLEQLRDDHIQVIAIGETVPAGFAEQFSDELTVIQCDGFTDVSMKGITKAVGMQKVLEATGVKPECTLAIGDGGNDRAMLLRAGVGVAMANAHPELLAVADDITASNLDCGVADAICKYLL